MESEPPLPVNVTLFGNKLFVDIEIIRWGRDSMLTERGNLDTETHTEGRLCEDTGRITPTSPRNG